MQTVYTCDCWQHNVNVLLHRHRVSPKSRHIHVACFGNVWRNVNTWCRMPSKLCIGMLTTCVRHWEMSFKHVKTCAMTHHGGFGVWDLGTSQVWGLRHAKLPKTAKNCQNLPKNDTFLLKNDTFLPKIGVYTKHYINSQMTLQPKKRCQMTPLGLLKRGP